VVELNQSEIGLLFKKLVLIPEEQKPTDAETNIPKTKADEPIVKYDKPESESTEAVKPKTHPFVLVTSCNLSQTLKSENSNLYKILTRHNLTQVLKYISDIDSLQSNVEYQCIWSIGLTKDEEHKLVSFSKTRLNSPNTETLTSKEEKIAMYNPFRRFIESNNETFSHL